MRSTTFSTSPTRLAQWAYRSPSQVVALWAFVGLASIAAISQLRVDTSTSSFLDRTDPAWETYQRSLERHGGDELLVVALAYETPWSPRGLQDLLALTQSFRALEGVRRVDSLATVPLIRNVEGVLYTDAGLDSSVATDPQAIEELRGLVEADRLASRSLVSADGKVFAINVLLDGDIDRNPAGLVEEIRSLTSDVDARISGVPVFRTRVNSRTIEELAVFVPVTLFLLFLVVVVFSARLSWVATPVVVGGAGSIVAVGAMALSDVPLSLSTSVLPSIILALGCAYSMHFLAASSALEDVVEVADPVALSGLTTTLGFLAMATVPIDAIRELATFGATGVAAATLAALTIAPAARGRFVAPPEGRMPAVWIRNSVAPYLSSMAAGARPYMLATWAVLLAIGIAGLSRLEIATDIILWFGDESPVRRDYDAIRSQLSGITPVNVLIEAVDDDAPDAQDIEVLTSIDRLTEFLSSDPNVGKALSAGDPLRMIRAAFAGREQDHLPRTQAEIEQSLLLLSGMDRLDDVLHLDRRSANVVLRLDNNASTEIVSLADQVETWWRENGDRRYSVSTTGVMYEFARAEEAIAIGQMQGLLLAIALVGAILILVFRRLRITAIAIAANVVPVVVGFGILGVSGFILDAGTACLGSMALGIAVDDSIHLISTYRTRRIQGHGREESVGLALRHVLQALVMTTAAISAGFLALGLSDFTLIRNLGFVTVFFVVLCFLADITLLPALLSLGDEE